jgi:hypothetical protein
MHPTLAESLRPEFELHCLRACRHLLRLNISDTRGGDLDDEADVSSASVEAHEFFHSLAPPSTDSGFRSLWRFALDLYNGGPSGNTADWIAARRIAQSLLLQIPDDGPTRSLLAVMDKLQQHDGRAPENWRGYRALDEK